MPVYQYKGVHYTLDTTDAAVAKQRIQKHLGEAEDAGSSTRTAAADLIEGAYNTAVTGGASIFGGVAGAGKAIVDRSMKSGFDTFEKVTEALSEPLKSKNEGARRGEAFITEKLMDAVEGLGSSAVNYGVAAPVLKGMSLLGVDTGKPEALVRGVAEAAAQFIPAERAVTLAGRGAQRLLNRTRPEASVTPTATDAALTSKATEIAQAKGREIPTEQDRRNAARLLEGERDPNAIQYTGPEVDRPAPRAEPTMPLEEVPALDLPSRMALESAAEADLRGALGPAQRSARDRVEPVVEPVPGHAATDPLSQTPSREAPEAGALPGETAPYQAALDLTKPAELGMPETRMNPRTEDGLYALPPDGAPFKYPEGEVIPDQRSLLPSTGLLGDNHLTNLNPKLGEFIARNDAQGALQHIVDTSESTFNKVLAQAMLRLLGEDFRPHLFIKDKLDAADIGKELKPGEIARGVFDEKKGITLSRQYGSYLSENLLLHEMLHAAVGRMLYREQHNLGLTTKQAEFTGNINKLYKYVKENNPDIDAYGFKDIHEFVSEALTNPDFRRILVDTRIIPGKFPGMLGIVKTAWDAFTTSLMRILGMPVTQKNMTSMQVLLDNVMGLMKHIGEDPDSYKRAFDAKAFQWDEVRKGSTEEAFKAASVAPERKPKSYSEYVNELKAELPEGAIRMYGKALYAKYKEDFAKDNDPRPAPVGYDNRPHEEFKQDLYRRDGTQRVDDLKHPARGPGYPASNKHPVVRRVYDQVSQATVQVDNLFNKYFRGAETTGKRRFDPLHGRLDPTNLSSVARVESPDSVSVLMNKLNRADKEAFMRLPDKLSGERAAQLDDPVSLRAAGLSPTGIKFVQALRKANKGLWEEGNKARAARGLKPLPYRDDFLWTHVRFGTYQVFAIKDGKHGFLTGLDNYADAQKVAKSMQEQGMDAYAAAAKDNPQNVVIPDDSFLAAEKLLPDAESRRLFQTAVQEALKRTGVNKYALRRDSKAGGFAGSTEIINTLGSEKAFDGVMRSVETYFRQMSRYAGSAEYLKRIGETMTDADIKQDYPNAYATAAEMKENFVGKDRLGDAELRTFSTWLGKQPVFNRFVSGQTGANFLTGSANVFVNNALVWLNPVFYLASAMQHFTMPPRLMQINAKQFEGKGSVSEAMVKGQMHLFLPSARSKEILRMAMDNGSIEPRFVEALDWIQSNNALSNMTKTALLQRVAGYADSFGRASAYTISFEFSKSLGMDDAKAHSFAARESQGVMVQYERWARMPLLNTLGVAGDAMAPLTHFVSNYAFNLGSYMKDAVSKGKQLDKRIIGPALVLLSSQLALAGIKGMPFYQDLEDSWLALNKFWIEHGGERMPMPSEIMAEMGVPKIAQDGVVSTLSGINATGTLGAGTIVGNLGETAALTYAWDIAKGLTTIVDPTASVNEKRVALQNLPPPIMRQYLNNVLQGKYDPRTPADVQDTSGNLVYRRNESEQLAAAVTGRQTLGESEAKKARYQNMQLEAAERDAKARAKKVFVESVMNGDQPPAFVAKVFGRYPELYDEAIKELGSDKSIINKNVPYRTREVLKNVDKPRDLNRVLDIHRNADRYANQ